MQERSPILAPPPDPAGAIGHLPMTLQGAAVEPQDIIRKDARVAFFVDADNIGGAASALGFKIDWKRALDLFLGDGTFADAYFYCTVNDPKATAKLDALAHYGFTIVSRPLKTFDQTRVRPANLDNDIIIDMLNAAPTYDVAILFSGNSGFERLVRVLRDRAKRTYLVTSRATLARELAYAANKPVFYLEHYESLLTRESPSNDTGAIHTQRTRS